MPQMSNLSQCHFCHSSLTHQRIGFAIFFPPTQLPDTPKLPNACKFGQSKVGPHGEIRESFRGPLQQKEILDILLQIKSQISDIRSQITFTQHPIRFSI